MRSFQFLVLALMAIATVRANYNPYDYNNENHPKKAMVDSLRNQLHELKTGVLQGHVINKKSNADGRVSRAGETLRTLGDYTDRGNTQEGVVKLLDLARKLQEKDEL